MNLTDLNRKLTTGISLLFFLGMTFLGAEENVNEQKIQEQRVNKQYKNIDRFIENYDYNRAISALVDIVQKDPEQMDRAQAKIREIRKKKDAFNEKYSKLIDVLFEENDYEKGLALITELEMMDRNPNDSTSRNLNKARISAELIYFRLLFTDIMNRAAVQLARGEYDKAVKIYREGLELHRRTYNERDYGDMVKAPADENMKALEKTLENFLDSYGRLNKYRPANLSFSIQENQEFQTRMLADFTEFSKYRNILWKAGYVFERQNRILAERDGEIKEDFFLSFANRLVFGRLDRRFKEGLVCTVDAYWESYLVPVQEAMAQKASSVLESGQKFYKLSSWKKAREEFDQAAYWAEKSLELVGLWRAHINVSESWNMFSISNSIAKKQYIKFENALFRLKESQILASLSSANERYEGYAGFNPDALEDLLLLRQELVQEISVLSKEKEGLNLFLASFQENPLYTDDIVLDGGIQTFRMVKEVLQDYRFLDGDAALAMAELEIQPLEALYALMQEQLKDSRAYIKGVRESGGGQIQGEETSLYVYPQKTLVLLKALEEEQGQLNKKARKYKDTYQKIREEIPQKESMAAYIGRAEALILNLEQVAGVYALLRRKSEQNIASAQTFLGEGEFRISQAGKALKEKKFPLAKQQLAAALDLFVKALSYNEEAASRKEVDQRITALQDKILKEENREVVLYVRAQVNKGKSLYFQGLYGKSETVLLGAESRWFTTNTDPNKEISYWMNLVRTALSVESGRTIEETEPLYKEIAQFLNLAFSNFEAGKKKLEEGDREGGMALLAKANENLNEVLITMPLNQQASVLKLKIQQLRDPAVFKQNFRAKFKNSLKRMDSEPDTAYIDLKDLSAIQPDYPGLAKAIYNVEILLGIRRRPPNVKALNKSKALYKKAYAIIQGNVRSQFPVALKQLDKAIELNPENQAAIELKDRIQLDAGGQTAIVLSLADKQSFEKAEALYIGAKYFEAYALVQQMLQNKKTASYPPLQELKRRIESKF